jgi:long-chain acyl-CoA synthetase
MENKSLYHEFQEAAKLNPDKECLGWMEGGVYRTISYNGLLEKVSRLSNGLFSLGVRQGDRVSFMLNNGPSWVMVDMACASLGAITVPIHTTYGFEYIDYIVRQTEAKALFIESEFYETMSKDIKTIPLERIIVAGKKPDEPDMGEKILNFEDVFSDPIETEKERDKASRDSVHTIVYTSGTTGKPKGVVLTHANIIDNVSSAKKYIPITANDRFFSFLPLSHALERTAGYYTPITSGASIYYARNKNTIKDDIVLAKPTIIISVPRIFEKVYDAVWDKVRAGSHLKQKLFYKTLSYGTKKRKKELNIFSNIIWRLLDTIVAKKIRASLGGRLRFSVSGGSALSADIMQFFEDIGILILEGYGLTEVSPVVSANPINDYRFGTVGKPLSNAEVKISQDHEILVRGSSIMKGYYKDDESTKKAIDSDGWFYTGDLGGLDSDGFLTITGRRKEMIVLSTGKNIFPVPVEQDLNKNKYVSQAMVYGNNQNHLSAVIVPDLDELKMWSDEQGIEFVFPDILKDERTQKLYEREISSALNHFPEYEQVREFKLISEEFSLENDMLTPTLKLKRNNIFEKYVKEG